MNAHSFSGIDAGLAQNRSREHVAVGSNGTDWLASTKLDAIMFTGLIETTGTILSLSTSSGATRITVSAPALATRLRTGDSVAVSGVCLTALDITPLQFSADLAAETVARTSLSRLAPGSVVNLELPTPAGSPLGGHIVQGHVDGVGTLLSLAPVNPSAGPSQTDWRTRISVPSAIARYVAEKGSITVEGISLTVASIAPSHAGNRAPNRSDAGNIEISIAIIPHTYAATNLHTLPPGCEVNLEADVLAKYAERRSLSDAASTLELTVNYLLANGY
ncbi:MAG: riboflavin synthase [Acidobacteriaceae bacterium]